MVTDHETGPTARRSRIRRGLLVVLSLALLASGVAVVVSPRTNAPLVMADAVRSVGSDVVGGVSVVGVGGGGRGVDDVAVVGPGGLVGSLAVVGSGEGVDCLSGEFGVGLGCVVSQLQPEIVAPSSCGGLAGDFLVRVGSVNGSGVSSFAYPGVLNASGVPTAVVVDGEHGRSYSWAFSPESPTAGCAAPSAGSWRTFRVDVVRAGVEESFGFGPLSVGVSSGAVTMRVDSTRVGLVGGASELGLAYRSSGASGYVSQDPTETLPGGWALDGLGAMAPWVTVTQVGSVQGGSGVVPTYS